MKKLRHGEVKLHEVTWLIESGVTSGLSLALESLPLSHSDVLPTCTNRQIKMVLELQLNFKGVVAVERGVGGCEFCHHTDPGWNPSVIT